MFDSFFCVYVITHKFVCLLFVVCCRMSVLCCASVEKCCLSLLFLLADMMFVFSICNQYPGRSCHCYTCNTVWFFCCTVNCSYILIVCILGPFFDFAFVCTLLQIKYVFVVCCFKVWRMCVLCCVYVDELLFVVVFPFG